MLILVQAGLGAAVVKSELDPLLVTLHYANAMLLVATLVIAVVTAYVDLRTYRATGRHRRFANVAAMRDGGLVPGDPAGHVRARARTPGSPSRTGR